MATWTFSIGGITLTRFEVPSQFEDGVEGHLAVHRYINESGTPSKKVHALGAFPLDTSWEGKFLGVTAMTRHVAMKQLAAAQQQITWICGPLTSKVVVQSYSGIILHELEIHYKIDLIVIEEKNGSLPQPEVGASFDVGSQSFYDSGNQGYTDLQTADPNLPSTVTATYAEANALIQGAYPLKLQPISVLQQIVAALFAFTAALQTYTIPLQQNALLELDLQKLDASLRALQGFGLLTLNLEQIIGTAPAGTLISVATGDLFSIAAQYYPGQDVATVAEVLAGANNLTDYFINAPTSLVLPPLVA